MRRRHLLCILLLVVVCYLAFFRALGNYALWDPDEGRTGVIAKEMVASGNWVTLTRNGEPYYDKPALYFWLVAFGLKLLGLSELAVRFPSALAASLTIGVVYFWGSVSGGWKWGLWSGLVLGTSLEFVALGRFGNTDMVFTLFFSSALLYFLWWRRQSDQGIWPFYLLLAVASLTKGPVGVLLPILIIGVTLGFTGEWSLFGKMHLLRGIGVVALVAGPWYFLAAFRDPEYIKTFLWDHNILRFLTSQKGIDHPEPVYYLFAVLAGGFLPWIFFLPPLLHQLWERREREGKEERLFLLVWVTAVLLFFSLARNKLGSHILPAFPPLALLSGDLLRQYVEGSGAYSWRERWILFGCLLWLVLIFSLFPLSEMIFKHRYPQYFPLNFHFIPAFFFLLAVLSWVVGRKRWTPWIVSFSSLWLILWFYGVKAPEISEFRSTRSLAQLVNGNAAKGYRVVSLRGESLAFYLPDRVQVVSQPSDVERMLDEPTPTIALVKERHLKEMKRVDPARFYVWKTVPLANALVANFPPSPAQDLGRPPKS